MEKLVKMMMKKILFQIKSLVILTERLSSIPKSKSFSKRFPKILFTIIKKIRLIII